MNWLAFSKTVNWALGNNQRTDSWHVVNMWGNELVIFEDNIDVDTMKMHVSLNGIPFLAAFGNVDRMWQFYKRLWFGSNIAILDYSIPSSWVKT